MVGAARTNRWWSALHVLGLWAIAVAQPLLNLLGKNPTFFIAHRSDPLDVVLVAAGLVLLLPGMLALFVWLSGRLSDRLGVTALYAIVAALVGTVAMQAIGQAEASTWTIAAPVAAAAGVAAAWAYARAPAARTFATALSLSVVVVPAIFFSQPDVRRLLGPHQETGRNEVHFRPGAPPPAPVLLVVMDETPLLSLLDAERRIDPVLYPNLAHLAHDGVWFRNATAVSDDTRWAVPAMLSGRYPHPAAMPTQADYPETLLTLLQGTHYLEVAEAITRLCGAAGCVAPEPLAARLLSVADDLRILYLHIVLTHDLRRNLPRLDADWARWGVRGAVERRERTRERLERRTGGQRSNNLQIATDFAAWISKDDREPAFYFFHSLLPHSPWQWLPTAQRNATRTPLPDAAVPGSPESDWGVTQQHQRHLMQSAVVDRVIGLYVRRLKEEGLYDRSLMIVAADHGVAFQPGLPRRQFTDETAAEVMRVPLIVKFPPGERRVPGTVDTGGQTVSDRNAETVDIAPTVLDVLGLEVPWTLDGGSLRRPLAEERRSKTIIFGTEGGSRTFDADGPDLGPALRRKLERFGPGGNTFAVPRAPRFADLVGRPVAGFRIEDGGGNVSVDALSSFTEYRPTSEASPFDVAGRLARAPRDGEVYVAVAVNGTIRAVTRTWDNEPLKWLATPPLDSWRIGPNEVEVFLIRGQDQDPVLLRTALSETPGSGG